MGLSTDYPNVPDWVAKSEGYQTGAMVKYKGNIFYAAFWASEPGVGDADHNGWRFYDELYDQTAHTPTAQAKIIAYIPTWRKQEGFNYANREMYQYITHGIIAFLTFSETHLGQFDAASVAEVDAVISDIVSAGHQQGTRISIALGGANDYGFLNLMTAIGNNATSALLDQAVQNVVHFVQANNLDGVDLDLECWWGKPGGQDQGGRQKSTGPHPAGYALTLFAQKLKQVMPDKLVSVTLFGTSWYGNNYDAKIADYVDWLAIMSYDLTGSWNTSPVGPHSALYKIRNQASYAGEQQGQWPDPQNKDQGIENNPILSVEDTLWYWTNPLFVNWQGAGQRIPRNKIAAGVPLYGYDFAYGKDPDEVSRQVPPGYKSIRYKDILAQFPGAETAANGNIKVSGSTPRPPFISASGNYPYAHNIYFETPGTAVTKLNFLKGVGAQGVIIWELSNDVWEEGKSIIKALYKNSGNPAIPSAGQPQNWMSSLPDIFLLSQLSIPGTHESCARQAPFPGIVAQYINCQDWLLEEQLNHGIRYIDIRCRRIGDVFTIHHDKYYLGINFGAGVRDVCVNFLKENPGECIIMQIKEEYIPENNPPTFQQTFDSYVTGFEKWFYLDDHIPRLSEVREKIVVVRRFGLDQDSSPRGIPASPWHDNTTFSVGYTAGNGENVTLKVQDHYSLPPTFEIEAKWNDFSALLDQARSDASSTWYINEASANDASSVTGLTPAQFARGYGIPAGDGPPDLVEGMNSKLQNYLAASPFPNRLGTLLMDFPDDDTIGKIIGLNTEAATTSGGVVRQQTA